MSENKGKAKVKAKSKSKSKSTMKSAGKSKAAVMNSRNPKKPMAISGDTMSNYAMYKKGGKVSKIKKYQLGRGVLDGPAPSINNSSSGSFSSGPGSNIPPSNSNIFSGPATAKKGGKVSKIKKFAKGGSKLGKYQYDTSQVISTITPPDNPFLPQGYQTRAAQLELINKAAQKEYERRNRELQEKYLENLQGRANKDISKFIQPELDSTNTNSLYERMKGKFTTAPPRKKGGPTYKKGGVTKAKKFAALAPPYNKATAADRIAGAKKNSRKK